MSKRNGKAVQTGIVAHYNSRPNNNSATKHGGEAALDRIKAGEALTGPAREAELSVTDELNTNGRRSLVVRNAVRLQAVADLFWAAVNGAAERQDLQALDRYVARFGWLASASLRAWAQVAQEEKEAGQALDYERILQEQGE